VDGKTPTDGTSIGTTPNGSEGAARDRQVTRTKGNTYKIASACSFGSKTPNQSASPSKVVRGSVAARAQCARPLGVPLPEFNLARFLRQESHEMVIPEETNGCARIHNKAGRP